MDLTGETAMSKSKKNAAKSEDLYEVEVPERFHAFADNTGRFAVDQLLREYGFKIYCRIRDREPLWELFGKIYKHNDAIKEVCFRRLEQAVEMEEWYARGLYR
jgi:hypothetical protein